MNNVDILSQLVLRERQGRDRGWWAQMADAWWPDGRIRISWLDGSPEEFVRGSQAMAAGGTLATHRMGPPIVGQNGDRAIVEASAVIELRTTFQGVAIDLASRVRLIYRAERRNEWKLVSLECIYANDAITLVDPASVFVPSGAFVRRSSYRWLTEILEDQGHPVADGLPGDDRPETVAAIYEAATLWLERA